MTLSGPFCITTGLDRAVQDSVPPEFTDESREGTTVHPPCPPKGAGRGHWGRVPEGVDLSR